MSKAMDDAKIDTFDLLQLAVIYIPALEWVLGTVPLAPAALGWAALTPALLLLRKLAGDGVAAGSLNSRPGGSVLTAPRYRPKIQQWQALVCVERQLR